MVVHYIFEALSLTILIFNILSYHHLSPPKPLPSHLTKSANIYTHYSYFIFFSFFIHSSSLLHMIQWEKLSWWNKSSSKEEHWKTKQNKTIKKVWPIFNGHYQYFDFEEHLFNPPHLKSKKGCC